MYLKKDSKIYKIERKYQHSQAKKANIDFMLEKINYGEKHESKF